MQVVNSIDNIASAFSSKGIFQASVSRFDFKISKVNNELLKSLLESGEINKDDVRLFRVLIASDLFNNDIKEKLETIQISIS